MNTYKVTFREVVCANGDYHDSVVIIVKFVRSEDEAYQYALAEVSGNGTKAAIVTYSIEEMSDNERS